MCFIYSDLYIWPVLPRIRYHITPLRHDLSLGLWLLQKHLYHFPISKITNNHGRTTLIFQKFLFNFSTWHHHDTYIIGHMTLGVQHTAWNYQSPSSRPSRRTTARESRRRAALLYLSHNKEEHNIFTTNHDGRTKNTLPNRIPPQLYRQLRSHQHHRIFQ